MASGTVRFGIELDRKTDAEFDMIAREVEGRSKRSAHSFVIRRIVSIWKEQPEKLLEIGVIRKAK